jgi:hypothetical protein
VKDIGQRLTVAGIGVPLFFGSFHVSDTLPIIKWVGVCLGAALCVVAGFVYPLVEWYRKKYPSKILVTEGPFRTIRHTQPIQSPMQDALLNMMPNREVNQMMLDAAKNTKAEMERTVIPTIDYVAVERTKQCTSSAEIGEHRLIG